MWADGTLFKGAHPIDESSCSKAQSRRRDFLELSGIYALILLVIWTPRPYQKLLWCVATVIAVWVIAISFEGFRPMGLCTANLRRSLWCVGLAAALALAAVALAGRLHTLHTPSTLASSIWHYIGYALWATVQEIMLQCFFVVRSLRLMKKRDAGGGVFGVPVLRSAFAQHGAGGDHAGVWGGGVPVLPALSQRVAAGRGTCAAGDRNCDHDSREPGSQHARGRRLPDVRGSDGGGVVAAVDGEQSTGSRNSG